MIFDNPLHDIEYKDIIKLKDKQTRESDLLDYKKDFSPDNKDHIKTFLREVSAFLNTSGGYLIYGIEETGHGGYPKDIIGINIINHESLEQIVIDCIKPRIKIRIKPIPMPNDPGKVILVIQIPEGHNQPYLETKSNQYHKRYNYSTKPLEENEIEAFYQKRFFGVGKLAKYVDDIIFSNHFLVPKTDAPHIEVNFIITPFKVDERIIDNTRIEEFGRKIHKKEHHFINNSYLNTIPKPSMYGLKWGNEYGGTVGIHRNGLIHYMLDFGHCDNKSQKILLTHPLKEIMIDTIQFAGEAYSELNFNGKVKLVLKIMNTKGSVIHTWFEPESFSKECEAEEIYIDKEWTSWGLSEDCRKITNNLMDELSNYYELWESPIKNINFQ